MKRGGPRRPLPVETLRIDQLAIGGAGVAKREGGGAVFVPLTAPGDVVEANVDPRGRPARGTLRRILEAGPDRVEPPCPYHARCGACDWMQLRPEAQRAAHRTQVVSAIRHATQLESLPELREHAPASLLGYRTRARLLVRASRGGRVEVGYRAAGTHELCAVDGCVVLDPALAPLLVELPALFAGASGQGDVLAARGEGGRPVLDIAWRGELPPALWSALDEATRAPRPGDAPGSGRWAGAQVRLDGASHPQTFGDPRPVGAGPDGLPLRFAAGGFAQTSDAGAARLAERAAALAAPEDKHVLELFAGSGTLSILMARGAASFQAVELEADAAACARDNLAARGLPGRVVVGDADDFAIPPRAQVVVLDPPRTGAPGAVRHIAAARPRVVVYVACDVATLARDLAALLSAGYRLTDLETVELFPQTSHVETLVRLER
ncbi:MAG: RsmD family RNA methyltransferase [Polyangiaceae bacterium]